MYEVYRTHSVGLPFIKRNYKRALGNLEAAGRLKADPPEKDRTMQKGERTFADHVKVTFSKEA
jgi:hypothetical protein